MATGSSNELLSDWFTGKVSLHERVRVFVLEATRGGLRSANQDAGDVCIDDLQMTEGACESRKYFTALVLRNCGVLTKYVCFCSCCGNNNIREH